MLELLGYLFLASLLGALANALWSIGLAGSAILLVGVVLILAGSMLALLALLFTPAALPAWNGPRLIGGHIIEPREAQAYIVRGVALAVTAGIVYALSTLALGPWSNDALLFVVACGYGVGSLGFELAWALDDATTPPAAPQTVLPPVRRAERVPERVFTFADWDDGESKS